MITATSNGNFTVLCANVVFSILTGVFDVTNCVKRVYSYIVNGLNPGVSVVRIL